MFSSDKIIFNNKMHEIDDAGTNELNNCNMVWKFHAQILQGLSRSGLCHAVTSRCDS